MNFIARLITSQKVTNLTVSLVLFLCTWVSGHGNAKYERYGAYKWLSRSNYYYPSIEHKMKILTDLSESCKSSFKIAKNSDYMVDHPYEGLIASSWPIEEKDSDLKEWWLSIPAPKQHRVEPFLCEDVWSKRRPIFNNSQGGCQLRHYMHESSPRCQITYLEHLCSTASIPIDQPTANGFIIPESDHRTTELPPQPYLVRANDVLVSMCGDLLTTCGVLHPSANCMSPGNRWSANAFKRACKDVLANGWGKEDSIHNCNKGAPWSTEVHSVSEVFVIGEVDDTYVYHIHLEVFPRLLYHLDWLKAHPEVLIVYGCDSKKNERITQAGLEAGLKGLRLFLDYVGLDATRLVVHKHVYAKTAWLPMEGGCQDPIYNTWYILYMRKFFFNKIGIDSMNAASLRGLEMDKYTMDTEGTKQKRKRPIMLLMKRSANTKHTRNGFDSVRQWTDEFAHMTLDALKEAFPSFDVQLYSDRNTTLMHCLECQIRSFAQASVLIGMHGAGLANMIYMPPNSAVMEIAPYSNDARCLLGGGPFSRAAALLGHNYAMHHPRSEEYKWLLKERASELDIPRLILHMSSFLRSINFV
eukprot:GSChrysophyteH1.ASY1.ANO1.1772.1 assembled CDS